MVFIIEKCNVNSANGNDGHTFEEALKLTKFGKFHYLLIFISGLFMGSSFWETMGINYVLPVAECDLNITSKSQYGIVSGIWFAGIILTSHLWGILADMFGRRKILIIASLSAFCASVLSSLAMNFWQMIIFRFLNGLCISGSASAIFPYLGEFLGSKNRSRSMMASSVLFATFCLLLPVMAMLVINQKWLLFIPIVEVYYKPWRLFLLACGLPSFVCGISLLYFPESPKYTFSQGNEARTLEIFKRMYYINTGKKDYEVIKIKPNAEFLESGQSEGVMKMIFQQTLHLFRKYPRSIGIVSTLQFGIYFVCNGYLLYFPDILNQTAQYMKSSTSEEIGLCKIVEKAIEDRIVKTNGTLVGTCVEALEMESYYYAMILEACYTIGFLVISLLVNYVGRISIFTFLFFTTGLSGIVMSYINNPLIATYLYVWLLVSGININLLSTVIYDLFPTNLRSLAMSISLMVGRFGALAGGNIAGYLLEDFCDYSFILSGVILLFCGFLTFFIPNIMKRTK